jgi:hypothetical protein
LIDQSIHLVFHLLLFLLLSLTSVAATVPGSLSLGSRLADVVAILKDFGITWSSTAPESRNTVVGA